jgi:hypothetical protein
VRVSFFQILPNNKCVLLLFGSLFLFLFISTYTYIFHNNFLHYCHHIYSFFSIPKRFHVSYILYKYMKVMTLLIQFGADLDARDNTNWTPLHYVALVGTFEVIKLTFNKTVLYFLF